MTTQGKSLFPKDASRVVNDYDMQCGDKRWRLHSFEDEEFRVFKVSNKIRKLKSVHRFCLALR
jgi:hypothetical protein